MRFDVASLVATDEHVCNSQDRGGCQGARYGSYRSKKAMPTTWDISLAPPSGKVSALSNTRFKRVHQLKSLDKLIRELEEIQFSATNTAAACVELSPDFSFRNAKLTNISGSYHATTKLQTANIDRSLLQNTAKCLSSQASTVQGALLAVQVTHDA